MSAALMVFAKAPTPGAVKTRLAPRLGPAGAARLHAAFVRDVVERHTAVDRALVVWRAGDLADPFWTTLGAALAEQEGPDLGARMAHAFARTLGPADRALVLGTDSPTLPPGLVDAALADLRDVDAVIGPACDGGYWGLGLRAPQPALFEGVPWGTDAVLRATLDRLAAAGLRTRVLPFWYDVDRPEDLDLLRAHLPFLRAEGAPLPHHTIAALTDADA